MKPIKLEFSGINSFSENTIIDFESLTKGGIFGIFGDTGSGKSTVLDCINFALYGNVERSKEKTDIINYRSDSAKVKFCFNIINDGKRKDYTVERVLKKDKHGTHKAFLYENDGEKEVCIADKASQVEQRIVEILGVEAEDFRKCIALPQGEFAQFVKSVPSERLKLMERLFSLSRYGDRLKFKISEAEKEIDAKFQNLSGRLASYQDVSEEIIKETESRLAEDLNRLNELKKLEEDANSKYEKLKVLHAKRCELEDAETRLKVLLERKNEIDELRVGFSSLTLCREAVKTSEDAEEKQSSLQSLKSDKIKLENEISGVVSLVENIENKIAVANYDERISECTALTAKYATCEGKTEKLEEVNRKLTERRAEYKRLCGELLRLDEERNITEREEKKLSSELERLSSGDIEKLINVEIKGAFLREEYVKNLDWLATLNGNIKIYKDDGPLYKYVKSETDNKIAEYTQRIADVRGVGRERINECIQVFQNSQKRREKCQREADVLREKLHAINAEIVIKQKELEIYQKDGTELRGRAEELKSELMGAFGSECVNYTEAIENNSKLLSELKREKERCQSDLENAKNKKHELTLKYERQNALISATEREVASVLNKLEDLIKSNGLSSIDKCRENVLKFGKYPNGEKSITDYDAAVLSTKLRIKELENIDGINSVTDEALDEAERKKSDICAGIADITGTIAVLNNEINSLKKRLLEKYETKREFEVWEKKSNLCARLKEVTKNNKFLEFIANEYLGDISSLASSTLLNLTGGRYFLTYKDNGFFVGDNFDCGNLRGVNTLSGGETFLVSLSLALALSQTICFKSQKSIEFFFLDEGFGTLDSSMVDTVMSALEKLKSSAFIIGVISHVDELKHRISNKITVNKATETHGSTVSVSC